jgi:hypothetical protein
MDYRARYYSPRLGRFISPDTIVPDLANPQALNRYAYVLGNALGYTDPSGHAYDSGGPSGMPPVDEKDPWYRQTAEFLMGAATQYSDDLAIGVPSLIQRVLSGGTGPEDYTSDAFQSGRQFGRYASYGHAVASIAMGSVEIAGSGALEAVTVGGATPVAVPVAAVGAAKIAHGCAVVIHNLNDPDPTVSLAQGNRSGGSDPVFQTDKEATEAAKKLGYHKTNYRSHGRAVYTNGKYFISPDATGHSGGAWKMARSPQGLDSKQTRLGTYDVNLNRIGD